MLISISSVSHPFCRLIQIRTSLPISEHDDHHRTAFPFANTTALVSRGQHSQIDDLLWAGSRTETPRPHGGIKILVITHYFHPDCASARAERHERRHSLACAHEHFYQRPEPDQEPSCGLNQIQIRDYGDPPHGKTRKRSCGGHQLPRRTACCSRVLRLATSCSPHPPH
jgi:hypothetical protein